MADGTKQWSAIKSAASAGPTRQRLYIRFPKYRKRLDPCLCPDGSIARAPSHDGGGGRSGSGLITASRKGRDRASFPSATVKGLAHHDAARACVAPDRLAAVRPHTDRRSGAEIGAEGAGGPWGRRGPPLRRPHHHPRALGRTPRPWMVHHLPPLSLSPVCTTRRGKDGGFSAASPRVKRVASFHLTRVGNGERRAEGWAWAVASWPDGLGIRVTTH
jgi:hypothetical protein